MGDKKLPGTKARLITVRIETCSACPYSRSRLVDYEIEYFCKASDRNIKTVDFDAYSYIPDWCRFPIAKMQ